MPTNHHPHLFVGGPLDGQYIPTDGTTPFYWLVPTGEGSDPEIIMYTPLPMVDGITPFTTYVNLASTPVTARLVLKCRQAFRRGRPAGAIARVRRGQTVRLLPEDVERVRRWLADLRTVAAGAELPGMHLPGGLALSADEQYPGGLVLTVRWLESGR